MARRNHNSRRSEAAPGWVWMLFGLDSGSSSRSASICARRPPHRARAVAARLPPAARDGQGSAARVARADGTRRGARSAGRESLRFLRDPAAVRGRRARRRGRREPGGASDGPPRHRAASCCKPARSAPPADADRLQASLALLGFESHVQRVTIDDDVFHRVRIGPIGDLDAAESHSASAARRRDRHAADEGALKPSGIGQSSVND